MLELFRLHLEVMNWFKYFFLSFNLIRLPSSLRDDGTRVYLYILTPFPLLVSSRALGQRENGVVIFYFLVLNLEMAHRG
jgi:hypothetical protein